MARNSDIERNNGWNCRCCKKSPTRFRFVFSLTKSSDQSTAPTTSLSSTSPTSPPFVDNKQISNFELAISRFWGLPLGPVSSGSEAKVFADRASLGYQSTVQNFWAKHEV